MSKGSAGEIALQSRRLGKESLQPALRRGLGSGKGMSSGRRAVSKKGVSLNGSEPSKDQIVKERMFSQVPNWAQRCLRSWRRVHCIVWAGDLGAQAARRAGSHSPHTSCVGGLGPLTAT